MTLHFDDEVIAATLWPAVRVVLASDPVRAWLEKLACEFYTEETARLGAA